MHLPTLIQIEAEIERREKLWKPLSGPQTQAVECQAHELFYGGAAGGGKSDAILGIAYRNHKRSIIYRREYPQIKGLEDRLGEIVGDDGRYNQQSKVWTNGSKQIRFGAVQHPNDVRKFMGQPNDGIFFDELPQFLESQFRFLKGWNRTEDPNQRCRVVAAGNPPFTPEGLWVIKYWGPWLDPNHPNPAKPGELRWYAVIDGEDVEVDGPDPIQHKGETISPRSRTFIPARVEDNPYLMESGYKGTLQAFPEPLRSMMLEGRFEASLEDEPYQVIKTRWVLAAQARWQQQKPPNLPIQVIGVDVAAGGKDKTVFAPRRGHWIENLHVFAGSDTQEGTDVVAKLQPLAGPHTACNVDSIGVGGSVVTYGNMMGLTMVGLNSSEGTEATDKSGHFGFANQRSWWWWNLRELLDPANGENICLPPDDELRADLCAPQWKPVARGIQVEPKDKTKDRIGRSPDKGDAVVYAFADKYVPGAGLLSWMERQSEAIKQDENPT